MTDDDMKFLGDELHELVDGIASTSPDSARDRARRGIARHQRNRRAAAGAAAGVVAIAAIAFVAVDRDNKDSQRPIGTTSTPTSAPTTTSSSTTTPSTTVPGSPIASTIPPLSDLPAATASYTKSFAWGTGDNQVAFHTPQGEGASGGPVAFTATADGDIVMLDHSSSRIVRLQGEAASAVRIALADPGVTAAAIDDRGRVIVANSELAVFGPQGNKEGAWKGLMDPISIGRLEVENGGVYANNNGSNRTQLLRDNGNGYVPLGDAVVKPPPVQVDVISDRHVAKLSVSADDTRYQIKTSETILELSVAKRLPDGSLVFVLRFEQGVVDPDLPTTYIVGRIDRSGNAHYETVKASTGYLVNGPGFEINDDGVAVMGSTTAGGVTVSYYPFS